jgi:hypothetical protein
MKRVFIIATALLGLGGGNVVWAQSAPSFEIGGQVTSAHIGELDTTDVGVGARIAWFPTSAIGLEGELNYFPSDIPDPTAVTSNRAEGLFGVTVGPRINRWRLFARARAGFLRVDAAPEPIACSQIFPPQTTCGMAAGETLFTADIGGGVEVLTPRQTFVRFDIGDRLTRYPGPVRDRDGGVHNGNFLDQDLRIAIGAGWRF